MDNDSIKLEYQSQFCVLGPEVEKRVPSDGGCENGRGKVEQRTVAFGSMSLHINLPGVIPVRKHIYNEPNKLRFLGASLA